MWIVVKSYMTLSFWHFNSHIRQQSNLTKWKFKSTYFNSQTSFFLQPQLKNVCYLVLGSSPKEWKRPVSLETYWVLLLFKKWGHYHLMLQDWYKGVQYTRLNKNLVTIFVGLFWNYRRIKRYRICFFSYKIQEKKNATFYMISILYKQMCEWINSMILFII